MNTSQQANQIDSYNKIANDYLFWDWTAKALLESANILRRERERAWQSHKEATGLRSVLPEELTEEVERMLQASAIECLLKGLFVKSGHNISENGIYKGVDGVSNHDLENLAKNVIIVNIIGNISKEQANVLRKLGLIGINLGRYPIARKYDILKLSNEKNNSGYDINSVTLNNDEQSLVDTFIQELFSKLRGR